MSTQKSVDKINNVIRVALEQMRDKCKTEMETIATQGGKGHFAYVCQQVGQEQAESVLALIDGGKLTIEISEMPKDEIISWAEYFFYNQYGPVGTSCPLIVKRAFDNIIFRREND